jgi:hypothetical protein
MRFDDEEVGVLRPYPTGWPTRSEPFAERSPVVDRAEIAALRASIAALQAQYHAEVLGLLARTRRNARRGR